MFGVLVLLLAGGVMFLLSRVEGDDDTTTAWTRMRDPEPEVRLEV